MISVLYTIILITNFKLIEMCIKSSPRREGRDYRDTPNVLLLVVYSVSWSHVNRCSAHFITLFYMP